MKKWMIGLAAAGGVFCLAGVGMIAAGVMMYGSGGRQAPPWLVRIEDDLSPVPGELTYENVRSLELETLGEQVQVMESADLEEGQVQAVQSGEGADYRIYQEGRELKVRLPQTISRNAMENTKMKQLTLYIPAAYEFDQIELEHVAGGLYAESLYARELSVEIVSGTVDIAAGRVKELEVECISGSCRCMAAAEYSASVENISGDTSISLAGAEDDFDYEIEAGGGSIYLNGEEQRIVEHSWKESHLNHHTGREVELSCASGTITVEYGK